MHIQTVGYPTFINYPSSADGAWYWRLDLAGSAEGGARQMRVVMANVDAVLDYDNLRLTIGGSGQTFHEYENPDQTKLLSYVTPIVDGFSNVLTVSSTADPYFGNFSFDLEIETPSGSGIFEPLSLDNATYTIVKAGVDFIEVGAGPEPPVECFWTDLVRTSEDCNGGGGGETEEVVLAYESVNGHSGGVRLYFAEWCDALDFEGAASVALIAAYTFEGDPPGCGEVMTVAAENRNEPPAPLEATAVFGAWLVQADDGGDNLHPNMTDEWPGLAIGLYVFEILVNGTETRYVATRNLAGG